MKIFREGTKRRIGRILIAGTTFLCLATVKVRAQQESTVQLQVNAEDRLAATIYTSNIRYHLQLAKNCGSANCCAGFSQC